MPVAHERYYQSEDGLRLFYREYGDESAPMTVICLPGLTRNSRDFKGLARHLADHYRVLCPDLRGRGFSAWDPDYMNYHPETYVRDILKLIELTAANTLALVGTSLGGLVSSLLARHGVPGLRAVVLNDVGPELDPAGITRIAGYVGNRGPMENWDAAVAAVRAINEIALPDLDEAGWREFAEAVCREKEDGSIAFDYDPAIGQAFRSGAGGVVDLWASFGALRDVNCLLLRGEISDILSRVTVSKMRDLLPKLRVVEVPGRGHAPLLVEHACKEAIDKMMSQAARH
jgi:pimeloyl-ACP methyl ester carboxylesterase